ncbi:DUF5689 domain-containing protein [uncultured Marixanthomonas sp.]|uniref:DUF5689 domain-containing protein n=1 Tax=uncultured Marixanthomonas sp. TaxID=757245 RepID=UPI0030D803DA|tara:strand:- start:59901 stop:61301 length:1401 start_codon:yes stop_codon:yes gene_type:complete
MKTFNFYKLITLFLLVVVATSCVKDDDYDVPDTNVEAANITGSIITIGALNDALLQEMNANGNSTLTFTETDTYVSGYVISSDEAGNFFEEIIIQDKASSPLRGVKVLVDVNPLFTTYEFGRKIFVKLDGLTVGMDSGVLTLGVRDGVEVGQISESQIGEFLIRDAEVAEITPLPINIADFTLDKTNLYVQLNNVQFNRSEVLGDNRKTFAGEPSDSFDGERILESCGTGNTTIFSTSTFADFKSLLLPTGQGTISGILTRNFSGNEFNIVVNDPSTINFDSERCDPEFFVCTTPSGGGAPFFNVNFEEFDAIEEFVDAGWTNVNVNGGSTVWQIGNFDDSNYAQISGFSSGEDDIETWLVTPEIDMDSTSGEELSFEVQASFDNGTILSVLFSTNFTGDVTTADWQYLDANIPTGPTDGFGDFQPVGPINVSCIDGPIHIAFLYEGSDPNATTRYHVDNIKVTGN